MSATEGPVVIDVVAGEYVEMLPLVVTMEYPF